MDNIERTFKLIDFILIYQKTQKAREDKNMELEKLKIVEERFSFYFYLCLNQINFFFESTLKDFDNFNTLVEGNDNFSDLKKVAKQLNDQYIAGLQKLKTFIVGQIDLYEKEMANLIIKCQKEFFLEYEKNPEIEGLLGFGLKAAGLLIVTIPALAIGALGTVFVLLGGLAKKIYDAFESRKSIINKIKKLELTLMDQWKSLIYNLQFETGKIKIEVIKRIKMIYNSQNIENIKKNKESFQHLFQEFIQLKEDIKKNKLN